MSEIIGDIGTRKQPIIMVTGVGGAGCNNVNRLAKDGLGKMGVKLIAANTDRMHLQMLEGEDLVKILMGGKSNMGMGSGGYPEKGEAAAIESNRLLAEQLNGVDLLFITAGMGGGTGTGASPVIAKIAKDMGALVIAIVTYPFKLERARMLKADMGIEKLRRIADTVVVIDNNRLLSYAPNLPIDEAFKVADSITFKAVRGISRTILEPSLINLDFADLKAIMSNGDIAMISVGTGTGPEKVKNAVKEVMNHPLLDVDFKDGKGALIHVTGGKNVSLGDVHSAAGMITNEFSQNANVVWGARVDENMEDAIEVISIVTGVRSPSLFGRTQPPVSQPHYEGSGNIKML